VTVKTVKYNIILDSDQLNICKATLELYLETNICLHELQGGSNMTGTDFFFVTIISHHSSNSQTGL